MPPTFRPQTSPHPCDDPDYGCGAAPDEPCTYKTSLGYGKAQQGAPRATLHSQRRREDAVAAAEAAFAVELATLKREVEVLKTSPATIEQPTPTPNRPDLPSAHDLAIADMEARKALGLARYGALLQPHNGRSALIDAYQEALDLAVYLRQLIEEDPALTDLLRQRVEGLSSGHGRSETEAR